MKKIFSLFVAVLFVGTVMAEEVTVTYVFKSKSWTATVNDVTANWTSGLDGSSFLNNGVQVSTTSSGANATSPEAFVNITKIVVTYHTNKSTGKGTFDVQIGNNEVTNKEWKYTTGSGNGTTVDFTTQFDYASPQTGKVKLTANCTTNSVYVVSVAVTYNYDSSAPMITANNVALGTIKLDDNEDSYSKDTAITITSANLTENITVSCPEGITADEASIDKNGGTLHLHITAAPGDLSQVITLTSGSASKEIEVTGKIKKYIELPGTATTMTKGESNAYDVTVDGKTGIKVGTSTSNSDMTIDVPAGAAVLHFYAAAWVGEPGKIGISADHDVLSVSELTLLADNGIQGGGSAFETDAALPTPYRIDVPLSNVAEATVITLASGTAKRFVVWGATYENATPSALDNAVSGQKTVKTIENGQLVIIRDGIRYNALGTRLR